MVDAGPAARSAEISRHQVAALLQHLYRWTAAAAAVAPPVAAALAPALSVAVQFYEAGQYEAGLGQLSAITSAARQARAAYPALPPL